MLGTARSLWSQINLLMAAQTPPNPPVVRAGPLVIIGHYDSGMVHWRASYGLAFAGLVLCVNHYRQVRLLTVSRAAAHMHEV